MVPSKVRCIGCGILVPDLRGPTHPYMHAAPGCWALYCSLEDWKISLTGPDAPTVAQWLVDGYAAQHPTNMDRRNRQSVAVHLMSLCASFERDVPGDKLRREMDTWTHVEYTALRPHPDSYPLTVEDVVVAQADLRVSIVRSFASGTWSAWSSHHPQVRSWLDEMRQH